MLVDERHLHHEQAYMESLLGWSLSRAWGTFGLVLADDVEQNLVLRTEIVDSQARKARIILRTCIGITPDGQRVNVRGALGDNFSLACEFTYEAMDCEYDVYVRLDPLKKRMERGITDNEIPLASPLHEIIIRPHLKERFIHESALKIGQLLVRGSKLEIDENYIPPCTGLRCHWGLQSVVERFLGHFDNIRRNSLQVAISSRLDQKGLNWRVDPDDTTEVFEYLCDHLAIWLGSNIDRLLLSIQLNRPPTELFLFTRQFFRLFDSILEAMGSSGRIKFHEKWDQWNVEFTNRKLFDENIHRVLECEYDHEGIANYLTDVQQLLGPLDEALEAVVQAGVKKPRKKSIEKPSILKGAKTGRTKQW